MGMCATLAKELIMSISLETARLSLEIAKDLATLLAAIGALFYFWYKIFSGWMLLNLSSSISIERESILEQDDHFVVNVTLVKGKVDSVRLLSAEIHVIGIDPVQATPILRILKGLRRIPVNESNKVNWDEEDASNEYLNVSTEESLQLSEHFRVKRGVVYRVELVVTGDRIGNRIIPSRSQWRASAISLPAKIPTATSV
jgi:hypothetical protein